MLLCFVSYRHDLSSMYWMCAKKCWSYEWMTDWVDVVDIRERTTPTIPLFAQFISCLIMLIDWAFGDVHESSFNLKTLEWKQLHSMLMKFLLCWPLTHSHTLLLSVKELNERLPKNRSANTCNIEIYSPTSQPFIEKNHIWWYRPTDDHKNLKSPLICWQLFMQMMFDLLNSTLNFPHALQIP